MSTPAPGAADGTLARRLNLVDAVLIGLGSMIGAGIFASFAPAAAAAGARLLVGLAIAGFIAFCKATSSAQLAAQYPILRAGFERTASFRPRGTGRHGK